MSQVRTVTLEFLRHGPPHNQLLSPLTQYLGLCGNFGAAMVHVPYEHREFLGRLRALRYEEEPRVRPTDPEWQSRRHEALAQRREVLEKTAEEMAAILASVPGLISGLCKGRGVECGLTHLQLVLSAAELAMLPFELTKVPPGCAGGEGGWLSVQPDAPICITRRVRTVSNASIHWPRRPRILFVAASPMAMTIPLEQHVQALLKSIMPWLKPFTKNERGESSGDHQSGLTRAVGEILTVLPNAALEDVERQCSKHSYTHVHILAHGMENQDQPGHPYGLALHNPRSKQGIDVVDGERFAAALRPLSHVRTPLNGEEDATLPTVVTVASCDSGNVKSVIYNGASFAHQLHQAGIPLVVASQFPLSFAGSVHMAEVLYEQLLWGEDPRVALRELRKKLYALNADSHDWASLVAYAALPDDLETQLEDVRYAQARKAIDMGMKQIDEAIDRSKENQGLDRLEALFTHVDTAAARMPIDCRYETEGKGLLASTEKRKAEAWWRAYVIAGRADYRQRAFHELRMALRHYKEAFRDKMVKSTWSAPNRNVLHWILCQYLSLQAVFGEQFSREYWGAAIVSAQIDTEVDNPETRAWAHSSLAELYLLLMACKETSRIERASARKKALEHISDLLVIRGPESFEVYATRRQFQRYVDWWCSKEFVADINKAHLVRARDWNEPGGIKEVAETIIDELNRGYLRT